MLKANITKKLEEINLNAAINVEKGEILVIIGENGAGKSTLLNLISGVVTPDDGTILINNNIIFSKEKKINIKTYKRKIGYVSQKSNLFPHMNIMDNIIIGIEKKYDKNYFDYLVKTFKIEKLLNKKPMNISGGEKQRVSLARTLISKPFLILFDEPFSAIDNVMKDCLRKTIKRIIREKNITSLFVTHDLEEGYEFADKAILMRKGKIIEFQNKKNLFLRPNNTYTKSFIEKSKYNNTLRRIK